MKECLLFTEKCFVLKYCFMFIALGLYTSSQGSWGGPTLYYKVFLLTIQLSSLHKVIFHKQNLKQLTI
jgi:hypothetical protein